MSLLLFKKQRQKPKIIILSFHDNVKEEKGERLVESFFWPSFSPGLKLFWFMCLELFREGAGNIANDMPVLINST